MICYNNFRLGKCLNVETHYNQSLDKIVTIDRELNKLHRGWGKKCHKHPPRPFVRKIARTEKLGMYIVCQIYSFNLQYFECFFNQRFDGGIGHLFQQLVQGFVDGRFAEAQYRQC